MDQSSDDLKSCLKDLRRKNVHCHWFIPGRSLSTALSKEAIRKALLAVRVRPYSVDEIVEHVSKNGTKIFGILVLIDQAAIASHFIEEGNLQDHKLPFSKAILDKLLSPPAARDFDEKQWEVIAPTFDRSMINKSLQAEYILPFVKDKEINKGAFGIVYEIELDKDHQKLEKTFQRKLVRKELDNVGNHKAELENLAILSHLRHPNLVELLASYTYRGKNNLVFPLAEGGTLAKLFEGDRQKTPFRSNKTSIIALAGLSSAIEHVHNFVENRIDLKLIGCHYDLRPKNILVSGSTLLLADFGLSRFKETSESSATLFKQGVGDYLAPECESIDDDFSKHPIRRSSDIWSFGCILAESITYMISGSDGVKEFRTKRIFREGNGIYHLFHRGPGKPNEDVGDWLSQLIPGPSRMCEMIITLIRQMLSMDEKQRPKAKEVTGTLRLIALFEVADSVDELLRTLTSSNSLDAVIEHMRFQSWRYALGILEQQNVARFVKETSGWLDSNFKSALDYLHKIQDLLKSVPSQPQNLTTSSLFSLARFNDCLAELLDEQLEEMSRSYFKTSILQDEVQGDLNSLSLPREVRLRATLKHMTELMMQHSTCQRQIDVKSVKFGPSFENRSIGSFQGTDSSHQVLVEWREYGRQSSDETVNHELLVRVDAIADLLGQEKPEEFRALDCRGFFHDLKKCAFGVVYDYPQTAPISQSTTRLRSLQSLLELKSKGDELYPTLDDRFRIAYTLCRSVLEFHLTGWLHKWLSSSNVAFFATTEYLEDEWFQKPYVVGFDHSRPDEVSAFTGGPEESSTNQHPLYLSDKKSYCAEFDYYSVGIILLEIGLWKPIDSLTRKYTRSGEPYERIRQLLIQKRVPQLKKTNG